MSYYFYEIPYNPRSYIQIFEPTDITCSGPLKGPPPNVLIQIEHYFDQVTSETLPRILLNYANASQFNI